MLKKVGEIWDYLMRRKSILLALILALFLGVYAYAKVFDSMPSSPERLSESSPEVSYNNSLEFVIYGQNHQPSYRLSFERDFQRANVSVLTNPLSAEAYIRILDEQGRLIVGEYTTMHDNADVERSEDNDDSMSTITYTLTKVEKQYTLALKPGYTIEVRTHDGYFYSALDRREAQKFHPAPGQGEVYVVMAKGLRRASWSETEGEEQMYALLRDYIVDMIANYQTRVTDEVLNNRHLDTANKTQLILSYYLLRAEDQAPYAEFIAHLRRGGSPVIKYAGPTEYELGAEIEIRKFLTAKDGEDGELAADALQIKGEVNSNQAGKYHLTVIAQDSDENQSRLELEITVFELPTPDPIPDPDPVEPEPESPTPAPTEPIVIEPILPVRPTTPSPETPLERPVVGILDHPRQTTTTISQATEAAPTNIDPGDNTETPRQDTTTSGTSPSKTDTPPVNYQVPNTTAAVSTEKQVSFSDIALIGVGVITFFGLIKFIFDHYVR